MNPLWTELATRGGHTLSASQYAQLDLYLDQLIEINQHINLTRITDRTSAEIKHVADALTLLTFLPKPGNKPITLADIGTGGGIPGVILAIARPDIQVTLIDSTRKKLDAVITICDKIGLTNVSTLHMRIEEVGEQFDAITARGVAELSKLIEWASRLMKKSTIFMAMKGPKAEDELRAARKILHRMSMNARIEQANHPELPGHVIVCMNRRA